MRIIDIRRLRGPNVHIGSPAVLARLDLEELTGRETSDVAGFPERMMRALPGLTEHHCAAGVPGGFVSRMRGGTYFGHVTEHVCLELSQLIGRDISFGRTVSAGTPGRYDLILECPADEAPESALPAALLQAAVDLVTGVLNSSRTAPDLTGLSESARTLAKSADATATMAIETAAMSRMPKVTARGLRRRTRSRVTTV